MYVNGYSTLAALGAKAGLVAFGNKPPAPQKVFVVNGYPPGYPPDAQPPGKYPPVITVPPGGEGTKIEKQEGAAGAGRPSGQIVVNCWFQRLRLC